MSAQATGKNIKTFVSKIFNMYGIVVAFFAVCIVLSVLTPTFLTPTNLSNVIRQISMIGITATGMTFVIIGADIDLSVGSVAALSGVLAAGFFSFNKMPVALALVLPLLIACAIGLVQGLVITKGRIHSFVASLGMLTIARGVALVYTEGKPISGMSDEFRFIGGGSVWIIPMPVILFVAVILIALFVLTKTPYGKYVYAIGNNREATRLSGINVDGWRTLSFVICSFTAALAGIILAARVSSGQPTSCEGWELDAIAAVIIGGTSMYGGRGGALKTLIGTLFLGVLRNGMNLLDVSPFYQRIVMGALIIVAVLLDNLKKDE